MAASPQRLVRSTNHRILAGVCGGLAARFGISPMAARIVWLLLSLLPGPMWVLYVILWAVMPPAET
ncbi:PspC domain-containing protein [bacterium]|nr:PspC domain-containing protein [bacterium]